MKISILELRKIIRKELRESVKYDTDKPLKPIKYTKPSTDLSTLTIGDLGLIIKYGYREPSETAAEYIKILQRITSVPEKYEGRNAADIIRDALKSLHGWKGKMADLVKRELELRIKNAK